MALEFKLPNKTLNLHNNKKILSNNDIFDLIVIDTNYNYRVFSNNLNLYDLNNLRECFIENSILGNNNFTKDENNNFITLNKDDIDLIYISDISTWTKDKYMVEFFGNENDKKLFQSLDITISKGIGIKNAPLHTAFSAWEELKSLDFCIVIGISKLEIYEHNFEGKIYKILKLELDTESN